MSAERAPRGPGDAFEEPARHGGLRRLPSRHPGLVAVWTLFAVSRAAFWLTGGRYSLSYLGVEYQLLDPHELVAHPLHSLLYLHIQPPLFNAFVAVVLRWSPLPDALSFQLVYLACGAVLVTALYGLLVDLGFPAAVAVAATAVVVLDPVLIAYENVPTYEYPVAMLLVLAARSCLRYARERRARDLVALVALLTIIVLTRALFHPVWLLVVLAVVLVLRPPRRAWKPVLAAVAVSTLAFGGWMLKNAVLFDTPTLSSWFGMNLTRAVITPLPRHDFADLRAHGELSAIATVPSLAPYPDYAPYVAPCRPTRRTPVLASLTKQDGEVNFNAECFLPVYAAAQRDAIHTIEARPGAYVRARWVPLLIYLTEGGPFPPPRSSMTDALHGVYRRALVEVPVTVHQVDWSFPIFGAASFIVQVDLAVAAALAALVGLGVRSLARLVWRRGDARDVAWVFVGLTVVYVTLVSLLFELGENGRFRAMLDPLLLGLSAASLLAPVMLAVGRARARRGTASASGG